MLYQVFGILGHCQEPYLQGTVQCHLSLAVIKVTPIRPRSKGRKSSSKLGSTLHHFENEESIVALPESLVSE